MARRLIKSALATALHYSGADRLVGGERAQLPLILGYHRVVADFVESAKRTIPAMLVSVATLERHIDWLARRYDLIGLDEAATRIRDGRTGRPSAVLTFDDGYRDVYENAFPLLQRKGIPCAVFVVTGLAGTRSLLLHDEVYLLVARCFGLWTSPARELARVVTASGGGDAEAAEVELAAQSPYDATRALLTGLSAGVVRRVVEALRARARIPAGETDGMEMMSWEMIRKMRDAGHVIGSHTRSHAYLTNEPVATVAAELAESRRDLEAHLGGPVEHLAYPNGDFNPAVAQAAKDAGYRFAYTVCGCRDGAPPEYTIPRRMVWERSGFGLRERFSPAVFNCETRGVFDRLTGCSRVHYA